MRTTLQKNVIEKKSYVQKPHKKQQQTKATKLRTMAAAAIAMGAKSKFQPYYPSSYTLRNNRINFRRNTLTRS